MKTNRMKVTSWMVAAVIGLSVGTSLVSAQAPSPPPAPQAAPRTPPAPVPPQSPRPDVPQELPPIVDSDGPWSRRRPPVVRIGQDHTLRVGDTVSEVVVVFGSMTIEGHVEGDAVAVMGRATIGPNAVIDGDLVVIGGNASIAPGAIVRRDLVVVAGALDTSGDFSPGGDQVVIGGRVLGYSLEGIVPWVTKGLLWGRLLVPDLTWTWSLVGIFFFIYLVIGLLLPVPVRVAVDTLAARPLSAFFVGLLVLLLVGPVGFILTISIIGLPVVPFVFCAVLLAALLGKVGVAQWIGERILPSDPDHRWHPTRSFVIGFAIITIAYMVPVLGLAAWAMLSVLGLGAASLAFLAALRRENPAAPRRQPPPIPPPAPPSPPSAPPPPSSGPYDEPAPAVAQASFQSPPLVSPPIQSAQGPPPGHVDLRSFPYAAFLERTAAFALDVLLVLIAFSLLDFRGPNDEGRFFLLLLAYHIGFWVWKGTTVGGIICQLRVIRTDGAPLRFADALVRGLSSILSLAALGIGGLWILRDPERQAWHDTIAGTYVVKVPKHYPLQ